MFVGDSRSPWKNTGMRCLFREPMYGGGNSTVAEGEEVTRIQCLFPVPQLVGIKKATKNSLQYPKMNKCLMVTGLLLVELTFVK